MFLMASVCVFAVFFANVALGAFGSGGFLSDVGEMVILFAASILFVAAILKREADQKNQDGS
ncbi:hypothetical protein [Phaeobacter gallaeciensis]|uniref:Uncharacterized protein n=1 Tax=Phaeobacter gallaeciensis TaxID=60890 RepID=A0AAD0EDP1_9RHOB|nr:hypothetical protein [Phaeobacter gallaeciensis]AHD10446.1 hypothetical protein Gal_02712 [Phaeobacter gallaeciensis DSM 26640]ATE93709.1 hypothetical protein PhaeoP11_02702 [Phaeobacter gallaeciensis]ATE96470.1 hypothetical protein PhaeoP73_01145 [Phaeobacter gallaeciensis]ATF02373.1 hypothetical protein PhaeoP75_02751 [Phaeobacter gallaeciensis]ATF06753.1 hypothetical protein PhaeoP63_02700 [Phaeobacter gallaeciensis]